MSLRYQTSDGSVFHQQLLLEDASTTVNLKEEPVWALVNEGAWGVLPCRVQRRAAQEPARSVGPAGRQRTSEPGR